MPINDNPFAKKDGKPGPPDISPTPAELEVREVCPLLTTPTMTFAPTSKVQQMKGLPPVVPGLTAGLAACIKGSCMFWRQPTLVEGVSGGDCRIREGLLALVNQRLVEKS